MESRTLKEILGVTEDTPKTPRTIKSPLELLELIMYGNEHQRAIGEVDQAYEDLKSYLKEVAK